MNIELVYAPKEGLAKRWEMEVKQGTTVGEVLQKSGIEDLYPEVKELPVGIYAKPVSLDRVLQEGDRIEIIRPLVLDPKERRRERARSNLM